MLTIDERRDFYRMMVDAQVVLRAANNPPIQGKCLDLSATGFGVLSAESLESGTEVTAVLESADRLVPPLQAKARVVRCSPQGDAWQLGLEILELR